MKKSILSLLGLAALAALPANASVYTVAGPIVNPANGHSYFLLSPGTWTESEAYAVSLGGDLVNIGDAAENAWVYANVDTLNPYLNSWIGLNDANQDGVWTWAGGGVATYLNWAPGEPNYPVELYGQFFGRDGYESMWNNLAENGVIYGIAEVVPEPSTFAVLFLSAGIIAFRRAERERGQKGVRAD